MKTRAERNWDTLRALAAVYQADNKRVLHASWWEFTANTLDRVGDDEWWRPWRFHELIEKPDLELRHVVYRVTENGRGNLVLSAGKETRCRGFRVEEN